MTPLLEDLTELVAEIDPALTPLANGYSEAVILLASLSVGADEEQIAAALEFDQTFVRVVGKRLREAGIWLGKREVCHARTEAWTSEGGGVAFAMDLAVALGDMETAGIQDDELTSRLTEQGRASVSGMGKGTLQ
ncbi:hypothetical protein [Methylobacterium gnaphalii]|uniref:Uncharacterized protein n=1 Tax=Methylobacterium gnaphalii TaxID=1010610 RepID=A0A512JRL7_9HYPH|nr:hypothetical protein [Methylobacterium gnaphalii]GEP12597.1 hypothetical protein MGN01_44420 [Methylobacterium gnaphalii]GJD70538.1 hypothetical protein MMMDOFMJ_3487 [Methylobacterium gnaphalii]GLS48446.1 hypothetical protein GCM10007885_12900 [Methylobacterium gnaphalii]